MYGNEEYKGEYKGEHKGEHKGEYEEETEYYGEDEPLHISWAKEFIDTILSLFDSNDVSILLKLKCAIEKRLLDIQNLGEPSNTSSSSSSSSGCDLG